MSLLDRLLADTARERRNFVATPIIAKALTQGVSRPLYLAYLAQAYHHVRFTCPLLELAERHCAPGDRPYREALRHYLAEEAGHEAWILADLEALGSSRHRLPPPNWANRAMVGYVHYAVEHLSPYAMLGMVHVLEGTSNDIATFAAERIAQGLNLPLDRGFSYLLSHGTLDRQHVAFFAKVLETVPLGAPEEAVVETARIVYRLWGLMFETIAAGQGSVGDAA